MGRILLACVMAFSVWGADQVRHRIRVVAGGGGGTPGLLQTSDFVNDCAGMFFTPYVNTGTASFSFPMTFRGSGASREYFMYGGDRHVISFQEPTLVPCDTALGSVNQATQDYDWGIFPTNAGDNVHPGHSDGTVGAGLMWDETTDQLLLSWYSNYGVGNVGNSLAAATLNEGPHTFTSTGCWGIEDFNTLWTGTGIIQVPQSFVDAHLSTGQRWALLGGPYGYATSNSYGPVVTAFAPPSGNACASNTDTDIGVAYVQLEAHQNNNNGPTCYPAGVGCTPAESPTAPYPAKMAFADYSVSVYEENWEPWFITGSSGPKHGWFTWDTVYSLGWYDDGVRKGVVVPLSTPAGWINQQVLASPAPTFNGTTGTFSITSTDTHDGYNINVDDAVYVQTCTPGVDPPGTFDCDSVQGHYLSMLRITGVNTGTGAITYSVISLDAAGGDHVPVVGTDVILGAGYRFGAPASSRYAARLQIYDPAQYAEVIATTRELYEVEYVEEIDLSTIIGQYGSPRLGFGMYGNMLLGSTVQRFSNTMVDPDAHQILIGVSNAKTSTGTSANAVYVFDVNQAPPAPMPSPLPVQFHFAVGAATLAIGGLLKRRS